MASEKVKTFTDNNFDEETRKGLVLVDFWAEWCGPCRRLAPTVDALASEFDGRATVAKLNVDENPNIPGRYAVRGIPTLLLFKEGELAETIVGLRSKEDIARLLERHLPASTSAESRGA
jgi:thioredoxin